MPVLKEDLTAQIAASRKATEAFRKQLEDRQESIDAVARQEAEQEAADVRTASMVLAAISKIPTPKDGVDGRNGDKGDRGDPGVPGINGKDGKDGREGKIGKTGKQGKRGISGKPGRNGKPGADGKNFDEKIAKELTTQIVKEVAEPVVAEIKQIAEGSREEVIAHAEGKISKLEGNLSSKIDKELQAKIWTEKDIEKAAVKHIEKNASKFKGESIEGKSGANGRDGLDGRDGKQGLRGKEGPSGKQGKAGKAGAKGKSGKDGKKGDDGVGIKNIHTEGSALKIALTDGKVKTLVMPGARATGKVAPIAIPDVQNAMRTPISAEGIASTNVRDAIVELKGKIVQSSVGNPFDPGTSESFMFTFNPYDETHDGGFDYDVDGKLVTKTIETGAGVTLYTVSFRYNGSQLSSKTIYDEINADSVTVNYSYDENNRLTGKTHTYTA